MPRTRPPKRATRRPAATATRVDVSPPDDHEDESETPETAAAVADATRETDPRRIPRAPRLDQDEFEQFVQSYPTKQGVCFYVYRLEPVIDRTLTEGPDAQSNIDKVTTFTTGWLKHKWGSGKYQVRFKDNAKPGRSKQVCDSLINIDEYTEFPPQVTTGELVDCDKNRSFINGLIAKRQAFRDEEGNLVSNDPTKKNGPADATEIADKALQFAERMMTRGDKAGSKLEEHAGIKTVDLLANVTQQLLQTAATGNKGGDDSKLTLALITLLTQAQQQQQNMMIQFMQMKQPAATSGLDQIIKVVDVLGRYGILPKLGAGAVAEDKPWWQSLIENVAPSLAPALANAIQSNQPRQPIAAPVAPAQAPAPLPAPTPPAAPTPAPAPVAGGIPAGAQQPIPATPPSVATADGITPDQARQIRALADQVLNCLERGIPGDQFAVSIVTFYGLPQYAQIAGRGAASLKEALASVPEMRTVFQMYETQIDQFIEDFISYGKEEPGTAPAVQ